MESFHGLKVLHGIINANNDLFNKHGASFFNVGYM